MPAKYLEKGRFRPFTQNHVHWWPKRNASFEWDKTCHEPFLIHFFFVSVRMCKKQDSFCKLHFAWESHKFKYFGYLPFQRKHWNVLRAGWHNIFQLRSKIFRKDKPMRQYKNTGICLSEIVWKAVPSNQPLFKFLNIKWTIQRQRGESPNFWYLPLQNILSRLHSVLTLSLASETRRFNG